MIFPMIEACRQLSLELMSFDVAPVQDLYTKQGVAVTVEAVAQIKVKSDPVSIQTASEQFLTKSPDQREGLIRLVMEGHLRGIIGQLTVEQIVKEPEMVADRMRIDLRRRHEQDGPRGDFVHDQGSPRQERLHRQHGPARRGAHQARRRRRRRRSRPRHRDQARGGDARVGDCQGAGRPGAGAGRDAVAGEAGGGAARPRDQEGAVRRDREAAAGAGGQGVRDPDQRHAAAGDGRGGQGAADRARAADQGAGGRDHPRREGADRDGAEAGRSRAAAHRDARRRPRSCG